MNLNFPSGGGEPNWFTYALIVLISVWGGLINYLGRVRRGATWQIGELLIELAISSFAGLVIGLIAIACNVSPLMSMALAGLAGHAGGRTVFVLDRLYRSRLDSLSNRFRE